MFVNGGNVSNVMNNIINTDNTEKKVNFTKPPSKS